MSRPPEGILRPEKVRQARQKIADGLDQNTEAIGTIIERLLPEILYGVSCWHCQGKGICNCSMCSPNPSIKACCQICQGQKKLNLDGQPFK